MKTDATPDRPDKSREEAEEINSTSEEGTEYPLLLKTIPEFVLLVASIYLFKVATGFHYVDRSNALGPGFWPEVLCVGIALCSLATIVHKFRMHRRMVTTNPSTTHALTTDETMEEDNVIYWPRVALVIGLVVVYPLATIFLGYPLATALLLITFVYLGGQRRWYIVPLGTLASLLFTYVFSGLVYISLPRGVGIFDIFTAALYRLLGLQ